MITRTATVLSLLGILVAGSAAAVVNSQVLQDSGEPTGQPSVLSAQVTSTTSSTTTATTLPGTSSSLPAGPSSPTSSSFAVGDAGIVSLDDTSGVLTLASAVPNPGWVVDSTGTNGFGGVRVTFHSSTVEVHFNAVLVDGEIVTSVDAESRGGTTGTSLGEATGTTLDGVTGTTIDDDDHDDDDHGDDDNSGHGRGGDDDHDDDNSGHGRGGDDDD